MNTIDPQSLWMREGMLSIHFWKYQTVIYWDDGKITVIPTTEVKQ